MMGGEWLIAVNTQTIPYLLIVATQHKTRQRRVGAQARKVRINDG